METHQFAIFEKHSIRVKGDYTVLVSLQDMDLVKTLLTPAIRAAKR